MTNKSNDAMIKQLDEERAKITQNATPKELECLARSKFEGVRLGVAFHNNTSDATLEGLLKDEQVTVRSAAQYILFLRRSTRNYVVGIRKINL